MKHCRNWSWRQKSVLNGNKFECVFFSINSIILAHIFFALIQSVNDLWVFFSEMTYFYSTKYTLKEILLWVFRNSLACKKSSKPKLYIRKYVHLRLCLYEWTHPERGFCFSFRISCEQYIFHLFIYIFLFSLSHSVSLSTEIVHCFTHNRFICKYTMNSVMAPRNYIFAPFFVSLLRKKKTLTLYTKRWKKKHTIVPATLWPQLNDVYELQYGF